jgi:hypothetical protein
LTSRLLSAWRQTFRDPTDWMSCVVNGLRAWAWLAPRVHMYGAAGRRARREVPVRLTLTHIGSWQRPCCLCRRPGSLFSLADSSARVRRAYLCPAHERIVRREGFPDWEGLCEAPPWRMRDLAGDDPAV